MVQNDEVSGIQALASSNTQQNLEDDTTGVFAVPVNTV